MSNMNRREFLRGMLTASAIASIPTTALTAFYEGETDTVISGRVTIDYSTRTVYISDGEPLSVVEFHRELKKIWSERPDKDQLISIV